MTAKTEEILDDEPRPRGGLAKLLTLLFLLGIGAYIVYTMLTVYIPPGVWGVKSWRLSTRDSARVSPAYGTGVHLRIPYFQAFELLPRGIQVMEFVSDEFDETVRRQRQRPAKIKLSGENELSLDLSVLYEIDDPLAVLNTYGYVKKGMRPGQPGAYKYIASVSNAVQQAVLHRLRDFSIEDFYSMPEKRAERFRVAARDMTASLSGITVHGILLRAFRFRKAIEDAIEEKIINQQRAFTTSAQARLKSLEEQLAELIGEGKEAAARVQAEGDAYVRERLAAASSKARILDAQGGLLVGRAEAERTELRRSAMEVAGADNQVSLNMVKVLEGVDVIVLPVGGTTGVNLLDVDSALDMLGAKEGN